jgi:hypothetical protein
MVRAEARDGLPQVVADGREETARQGASEEPLQPRLPLLCAAAESLEAAIQLTLDRRFNIPKANRFPVLLLVLDLSSKSPSPVDLSFLSGKPIRDNNRSVEANPTSHSGYRACDKA